MKLRAPLSALLAASLTAAPMTAHAASAAVERGSTNVQGERLAEGLAPAWLMAALLVAVLGIVVFSDDDEEAVSP